MVIDLLAPCRIGISDSKPLDKSGFAAARRGKQRKPRVLFEDGTHCLTLHHILFPPGFDSDI